MHVFSLSFNFAGTFDGYDYLATRISCKSIDGIPYQAVNFASQNIQDIIRCSYVDLPIRRCFISVCVGIPPGLASKPSIDCYYVQSISFEFVSTHKKK